MSTPAEKTWFLHYNLTQHGPFTVAEVRAKIASGEASPKTYAWKKGLRDWTRIMDLPELGSEPQESRPEPKAEPKKKADARRSPRKPVVARVLSTDGRELSHGLCQDISETGVRVLTDRLPGKVGTLLTVNLSPPEGWGPEGGEIGFGLGVSGGLPALVVKGKIVRVLPDGGGYGLEFTGLGETERSVIRSYLK